VSGADRQELGRLLARAADGDRTALDPLFTMAWPCLRGFCRRLVGESDADDAAQEAVTKVFARVATFDVERDALTWMLTIAAWECRTIRRRRARRREERVRASHTTDDGVAREVSGRGARPDEIAERRELLAAAGELLGTLSPTDAATLVAAWTDDVGARAAIAPATFRKRLERALSRFRAGWRSRHDEL
jgi:RNA polymerase sigma-70 factor (ECF subfamily)